MHIRVAQPCCRGLAHVRIAWLFKSRLVDFLFASFACYISILADDARVKTTRGPCHDAAVFYMGVEILTMLWLMWLASPTTHLRYHPTIQVVLTDPPVSRGSCGAPPVYHYICLRVPPVSRGSFVYVYHATTSSLQVIYGEGVIHRPLSFMVRVWDGYGFTFTHHVPVVYGKGGHPPAALVYG